MTEKHYRQLAEEMSKIERVNTEELDFHRYPAFLIKDVLDAFCRVFKQDNPNFDRQKFLEACEPKP